MFAVKNKADELRKEYLLKVYELTGGNQLINVNGRELAKKLGITKEEEEIIYQYLKGKNLIKPLLQAGLTLTTQGIDEVERSMAQNYAEMELLVLKTVDKLSQNNSRGEVHFAEVQNACHLPFQEFNEIITELYDRKRYLGAASDEHIKLSPAGKEFLQGKSNMPKTTGDIYNTHNYGNSINQFGGSNNNQIAQINLNPEFDSAIKSIVDVINSSPLNNFKKEDLISDIERIQNLAKNPPSPELAEHGKSKIDYLKLAVAGTDIALKVAPHLHTLYEYFDKLLIGFQAK